MRVVAFTSLTGSYLPNGRIIAKSFKAVYPDYDFVLLFNDRTPDFIDWDREPFDDVIFSEWLPINRPWRRWAAGYSVIEHCTATKGVAAEYLMDVMGYDAVVYLDPDTMLCSPLDEVFDIFDSGEADVVLTPHITDPETSDYGIWSHEIAALKHGTFNLGFFAVQNKPRGRACLRWWAERLVDYSHIDFAKGTFTDQKWANLAPYMFDGVKVLRDRTYNVATWNQARRKVTRDRDGKWYVNGQPMRFYHFSGFGHGFAWADSELEYFAKTESDLLALWDLYKSLYVAEGLSESAPPWFWDLKRSGERLTPQDRAAAADSQMIDPFCA
jgi:hypothetical protein